MVDKKPLLFLDVDGVLNTVCSRDVEWETEEPVDVDGFLCTVPKGTKERIARLTEVFEMHWLTTWEDKAHRCWHELIGVPADPEWPYVQWRKFSGGNKFIALMEEREEDDPDRPWVWIDDDGPFHVYDREIPDNGLILVPELRSGLTDEHVDAALEFAAKFAAS
jgi:hypothetical protein